MSKHLLAIVCALSSAPAFAQTDVGGFNGFYAGVQAGWANRSADLGPNPPGSDQDNSRSGFDYGAFAGFDATMGTGIVIGAEAEIGGGGKTLHGVSMFGVDTRIDPKWNFALTGRAGFLATDSILIYGRVGYGAERLHQHVVGPTAADGFNEKDWSDGPVFGGGVEFALSRSMTVRAEYRYKDFDRGYNLQQALLGVAFRF